MTNKYNPTSPSKTLLTQLAKYCAKENEHYSDWESNLNLINYSSWDPIGEEWTFYVDDISSNGRYCIYYAWRENNKWNFGFQEYGNV